MFLTVLLAGEVGGIVVVLVAGADNVEAVHTVVLGLFLLLESFLHSASSSIEIKSLQSE